MSRIHILTATVLIFLAAAGWLQTIPAEDSPTATEDEAQETALGVVAGHNVLANRTRPTVNAQFVRLAFRDLDGEEYRLEELTARGPVVLLFTSTVCPVAQRYTNRLQRLHEEFAPQGVSFFAVCSNAEDAREEIAAYADRTGFQFPVVKDVSGYLAGRLGATATPQVFVVDSSGEIVYRGAIDDNRYETRVREHYLHDALTAVLADEPVAVSETRTLGCTIHRETDVAEIESVTYASHIAHILQDNCQSCHRPNQVAPFALISYEEARTWATEVREYTHSRVMPPWKAAPGYGDFKNDASLTENEISLISRWVDAGMPQGDERDIPPNPRFYDEWTMGKPDIVLEMPEEYTISAEGEDDYRHFIIPTNFDQDLYVRMIDVRPGNLKNVHHVIVYVDNTGRARELDAADPGPGYTRMGGPGFDPVSVLGGWAPGRVPTENPPGTGTLLPKGADVVFQVHYYKTGFEETDRTHVGLYLTRTDSPVRLNRNFALPWRMGENDKVIANDFEIPPGESRYRLEASRPIKEPIYVTSVFPHMHVLGREMRVYAEHPDWDEPKPLVWIKDWDFNWQLGYELAEPVFLPKGATVRAEAYYDNSADNPNNPSSPPVPVFYGEKTTDEMCYAFFNYLKASEYTPDSWK